jgi:opacity protein-like surface antigen
MPSQNLHCPQAKASPVGGILCLSKRTRLVARTQGGTTMKNLKSLGIVAALALGLTTAAFAKPLALQTLDSAGAVSTPTVTFSTQGFSSTSNAQDATLDVYVPGWSLGVVGVDINGANLKITDVKAANGISVSLKDASGGATKDRLKFTVTAAANTPKGTYLIQVMLENKKFGDQGMITIMAEVK